MLEKFQMAISPQPVVRSTLCLVIKWGFRGRRIQWRYFRCEQIQDGGRRNLGQFWLAIYPQQLMIYLYSAHRAVIFAIAQLLVYKLSRWNLILCCNDDPLVTGVSCDWLDKNMMTDWRLEVDFGYWIWLAAAPKWLSLAPINDFTSSMMRSGAIMSNHRCKTCILCHKLMV